jgi:hypothetical protein
MKYYYLAILVLTTGSYLAMEFTYQAVTLCTSIVFIGVLKYSIFFFGFVALVLGLLLHYKFGFVEYDTGEGNDQDDDMDSEGTNKVQIDKETQPTLTESLDVLYYKLYDLQPSNINQYVAKRSNGEYVTTHHLTQEMAKFPTIVTGDKNTKYIPIGTFENKGYELIKPIPIYIYNQKTKKFEQWQQIPQQQATKELLGSIK